VESLRWAEATAVGDLLIRQPVLEQVVVAVADTYILTVAALDIQGKDTKAVQEYGKDLARLAAVVVVDLPVQDNKVMEMQAAQADLVLPYWDLVWAVAVVVAMETKVHMVADRADRADPVVVATVMVLLHWPILVEVVVVAYMGDKHQVVAAQMAL
jgi:hypothetical protein